jgi:MFS family permease
MNITTFNSFRSRNFRLFFIGQSLSLIGTWMQKTAVSWIIYSITQSKFMLGVSVFATLFPTALFSIFGGIAADRYNRYKLLLATQIISMLQAILLTLAVIFFRQYIITEIIILSALLGIINGYDVPARQSLVRELINDKTDLPNALALNSSMVNLSKLIGPALAGFVLEKVGDKACFGLNALSFVPVIISLLLIKLPPYKAKPKTGRNIKREFTEAFTYIRNTPIVNSVLILAGFMNLLVLPYSTLTPVFAKDIFNGTASTLGVLDGMIGLGAFVGAIYLASLKQGANLSKVLATNTFILSVGLMFFAYTNIFPLALCFIAFGAFGMMSIVTITNTIVQVNVPAHFQGRVISILVMILTAMMPLGSLLISALAHYFNVQNTVFAEGVIALIIALSYRRYLKKESLTKREKLLLEEQSETVFVEG